MPPSEYSPKQRQALPGYTSVTSQLRGNGHDMDCAGGLGLAGVGDLATTPQTELI